MVESVGVSFRHKYWGLESHNFISYAAKHLQQCGRNNLNSASIPTMSSVMVFFSRSFSCPIFFRYSLSSNFPPYLPPSLHFSPFTARVAETANVNRPELGSNACVWTAINIVSCSSYLAGLVLWGSGVNDAQFRCTPRNLSWGRNLYHCSSETESQNATRNLLLCLKSVFD